MVLDAVGKIGLDYAIVLLDRIVCVCITSGCIEKLPKRKLVKPLIFKIFGKLMDLYSISTTSVSFEAEKMPDMYSNAKD